MLCVKIGGNIVSQMEEKNQSDRGKTPWANQTKKKNPGICRLFCGRRQGETGILKGIGNRNGFSRGKEQLDIVSF
jgi:hypothetical protein